MKCPFLESEDCETCGYYDYVPEKKCYNCLHPFLNADDEKQQDWKKIVSYMCIFFDGYHCQPHGAVHEIV